MKNSLPKFEPYVKLFAMHPIMKTLMKRRDRQMVKSLTSNGLVKKLRNTAIALCVLVAGHTGGMMAFEGMGFADALWLSLTTIATVGYGDLSAKTALGRACTAVLMYGAGIAVMAQTASLFFENRQVRRERILNGKWRWNMDNHIVFVNSPKHNPNGYFKKLMTEFRKSAMPEAQRPAIVVTTSMTEGLSDDVRKLNFAHVNENITDSTAFDKSNLKEAAVIVVMNQDEYDPMSDSITFDLVSRVRAANPHATIVAEVLEDSNKSRILSVGADHVIRPIRAYPELLVRTVLAPGTERVVEDIFNAEGEECVKYKIPVDTTWGNIAHALIAKDIGTPLGYIDSKTGDVVVAAHPEQHVNTDALIVIVRHGNIKSSAEVAKLLFATDTQVTAAKPVEKKLGLGN